MGISGYHDVQDIGSRRGVVWVSGWGVRPKNETGIPVGIVTQEFPPPRAQPSVAVDMFGVQVAGHQDRQHAAKENVQIRSGQWAGKRNVCRKEFHRSTGQHNFYGICLQLGEAGHRYRVVSSSTPNQYGRASTGCWSVCAVADIVASRKAWPELRNVSLKRQISTRFWLRKCSSSSFLPHTRSAFQQVRRRTLPRTVLLGRAAIFGHEENNGLQDRPWTGCPCGERDVGCEEPTSQLHTCL